MVGHAQGGGHSLPRGEAGARLQVRPKPTPRFSLQALQSVATRHHRYCNAKSAGACMFPELILHHCHTITALQSLSMPAWRSHPQVESWQPCPHIPGCIVVNVGDSLQAWSDGILKSNYHRVRMPNPGEPTVRPFNPPCQHSPSSILCRRLIPQSLPAVWQGPAGCLASGSPPPAITEHTNSGIGFGVYVRQGYV